MKLFFCYFFAYTIFLLQSKNCLAQTSSLSNSLEIDSMLSKLKNAKTEKEKLDVYVELAWMYRHSNVNYAQAYSDSTIKLAKKLKENKLLWLGLNSKAEALRISGSLQEALKIHQVALEIAEINQLKIKTAHSLNNIGLILKRQSNYKSAIEYILKAKVIYVSKNDSDGMITTYNNLGNCYSNLSNYDEAISSYFEAMKIAKIKNDNYSMGNAFTNIGHCYYYMGKKTEAKDFYYKGMLCREKTDNKSDIADSYSNYAYMLAEEGKFVEANNYYQKALSLSKTSGDIDRLRHVYMYMAELAILKNDYKMAYYMADSARVLKDSIINVANIQSLNEMSQRFDSEKKQLEIENLAKENTLKEKENKQQKLILFIVGIALVVSIVLGISVLKQYKEKQKANHIISEQKEILEEKQKEIIDSITYAKHLQEAILPTEELIKEYLPESFILYKPKDIVAGDFYWLEHKADLVFIAAADCTGHGVPGAMVSVVCSNALNRVVKEFNITEPGKILDKTRELVLETFARSNKNVKDGMDISLCCINRNTKQIMWSGANNPLWYIENEELKEIIADKQPIGKTENPKSFTAHSLHLKSGDFVYLFTDGFADQFGGPKGKKLKYKPFKELILKNSNLPMNEQKLILESAFNEWKGNLEQVDDICVIGIRI